MKTTNLPFRNAGKSFLMMALLSVFLMISSESRASQIYIDLIPDIVLSVSGSTYEVDLNNDGIYDFRISISYFEPMDMHTIGITGLNDSSFVSWYQIDACIYAKAFLPGDSISESTPWKTGGAEIASWGGITTCMHSGSFIWHPDRALGLKVVADGETFYGWMRIEVGDIADWIRLKDYAYDNQPLTYMLITGVAPTNPGSAGVMLINPNPADNFINLTLPGTAAGTHVQMEIIDTHGQILRTEQFDYQSINRFSLSGFRSGVYGIRCIAGGMRMFNGKIVKQ